MSFGVPFLDRRLPYYSHLARKKPSIIRHGACRSNQAKAFIEDKAPGGFGAEGAAGRPSIRAASLLVLDYEDLAGDKDLSAQIEQAFGPSGLGALTIANVPQYPELRRRLLPQANTFASLPDEVKAKYEDPFSHFSVGWSHGKEYLADGQRDTHKGSFYANPLVDDQLRPSPGDARQPWAHAVLSLPPSAPTSTLEERQSPEGNDAGVSSSRGFQGAAASVAAYAAANDATVSYSDEFVEERRRQYPGYYQPNLWPREELPDLEPAVKDLGRLFCAVGCLLAEHCDRYVSSRLGTPPGHLAGILKRSLNPKARLLHYFPAPAAPSPGEQRTEPVKAQEEGCSGGEHDQPWCGWHTDHGSLTGLTAAMYLDAAGDEVPSPDAKAGLYIRNRQGQIVRAVIPPDCIAFQVGEALQVHSGGLLRATPHYVRAAEGPGAAGISRNTFAVFMQPDVMEAMDCPPGVDPQQVAVGQWRPGLNFGEFAEATFEHYYPKQQ